MQNKDMFFFFSKIFLKFFLDNHVLIWESKWQNWAPESGCSPASPNSPDGPDSPEQRPAIRIEIRSVADEQNEIKLTKNQPISQ